MRENRRNPVLLSLLAAALLMAPVSTEVQAAEAAQEGQAAQKSGISLDAIGGVRTGGTVTVSGQTQLPEVIVKVLAPNGTNVFYDIVLADAGAYKTSFTLPHGAETGTYQVVAGLGGTTASSAFTYSKRDNGEGGGSDSGNGSGGTESPKPGPVTPEQPGSTAVVTITARDIPKPDKDFITLQADFGSGKSSGEVLLPANLAELAGDTPVQLVTTFGTIVFPKEALAGLAAAVPAGQTAASLLVRIDRVSEDAVGKLVAAWNKRSGGAVVQAAGDAVDVRIAIRVLGGDEVPVQSFAESLTLKLKLTAVPAERNLAGIYSVDASGQAVYAGGKPDGSSIAARVEHSSRYGVFTYNKSFTDLPGQHWAYKVVKELAGKHIIDGVSDTRFEPEQEVTRAQFVTMLVKQLKLTAAKPAAFRDVPAGSWYADAIAAAYEGGIVEGTGPDTFAPEQIITREEIAVMMTRMAAKTHAGPDQAPKADFADSGDISTWARSAVDKAVHSGLMIGRTDDTFSPLEAATRAEAAQVIYNGLLVFPEQIK
ncbi:S-layer homology domain-containing protein [Paenibacillus sp. FJAT-26967]|uniref:S-layer homology domain-containing protein n=1 Tax=Paenibacillus sp. FJAT-26967 TaxID=1729690 RepID=UPI00083887E5|nr:S-layer homology domain-containing protein [Paenibacillus sp. FJAT-26967]